MSTKPKGDVDSDDEDSTLVESTIDLIKAKARRASLQPSKLKMPTKETPAPEHEAISNDFEANHGHQHDEANVDEMKIQTMYKMVEDIHCNISGADVKKKVLYLTNKQCSLIDDEAMSRCIQALEIKETKFVINLLGSLGVFSQMKIAHQEELKRPKTEYLAGPYGDSQLNPSDERSIETQILLFMRTCVLPLAVKTKALIIVGGANDCYLGAALSDVALSEQARLGADCPFTVVAITSEYEIHAAAISSKNKSSLSSQIARGSVAWKKRIPTLDRILRATTPVFQQCDLTPAASHYIIFESIDELNEVKDFGPKGTFASTFLNCMTKKVPSVAIQTLFADEGIAHLVRLAKRQIPVLLLDSTERAFTMHNTLSTGQTTKSVAAKLSTQFPLISVDKLRGIKIDNNDNLTLAGRSQLLTIATEMVERKWKLFIEHGKSDSLTTDFWSFFHNVLWLGADRENEQHQGDISLGQRISELERFVRANKDAKKDSVPHELVHKAILFLQTRSAALDLKAKLAKVEKWLEHHGADVEGLVPGAIEHRDDLLQRCKAIDEAEGLLVTNANPGVWLAHFDLFTDKHVYSSSIFDIDDIKHKLAKIAKIDRLPTSESLEALRILRDGWDHVEVYHAMADHYKFITKVCYVAMLVVGMGVTAISISAPYYKPYGRYLIVALSFLSTALVSYITFVNPAMKWQQLRVAALSIESNIWSYRTRSGAYRLEGGLPDELLAEVIHDIKSTVLNGADIKNTSFYSETFSRNKHMQHPPIASGASVSEEVTPTTSNDSRISTSQRIEEDLSPEFGTVDGQQGEDQQEGTEYFFDSALSIDEENPMPRGHRSPTITLQDIELTYLRGQQDDRNDSLLNSISFKKYIRKLNGGKFPARGVPLTHVIAWLRRNERNTDHLGEKDHHFEPVHPDSYVEFRIKTMLSFYKDRIPRCSRVRNLSQLLLVVSSIVIGVLAIADLSVWTAIASIFTSAVSALLEFSGTNGKIGRYSASVHSLQCLIVWWETLPQVDRFVVQNIDKLVQTCEGILHREQQSWKSTSQAAKMLAKETGESKTGGSASQTKANEAG